MHQNINITVFQRKTFNFFIGKNWSFEKAQKEKTSPSSKKKVRLPQFFRKRNCKYFPLRFKNMFAFTADAKFPWLLFTVRF